VAVITATEHREKQPHAVSGGAREHRMIEEERPGDRSEHGGASLLLSLGGCNKSQIISFKGMISDVIDCIKRNPFILVVTFNFP